MPSCSVQNLQGLPALKMLSIQLILIAGQIKWPWKVWPGCPDAYMSSWTELAASVKAGPVQCLPNCWEGGRGFELDSWNRSGGEALHLESQLL